MSQTVHYSLSLPDLHTHLAEVTVTLHEPAPGPLALTMPSWSPGSYLLREYGRHVQRFEASVDADRVAWRKTTRNTWQVEIPEGAARLQVRYRLFCHDLNVRANHVEDTHAFINGPSTFMLVDGMVGRPCSLEVLAPPDWRIHTGLAATDGVRTPVGRGTFAAADFDELVDCPLVMAPVDAVEFHAGGTHQRLVLIGQHAAPVEKMTADMARTIETSATLFGNQLPYDDYLTIILHNTAGRGGLEHRNSTVLMLPPFGYRTDEGYEDFLCLFSHEHFHVWNVKRIRPQVLGPFDYANENYTRALWIMEGVTCYYENVLLLRAGLMTPTRFTELLGKHIGALQNVPGRHLHSLEDASFDAWIKLYRPDESTPNTSVSYYLKGEVVAWALDLTIRQQTDGGHSLDDVMRHLWARYRETGAGFPEERFQADVEALIGLDLGEFFDRYVRGTDELDYEALLAPLGMSLTPGETSPHGWLGVKTSTSGDRVSLQHVFTDSPAATAGLYAGDELVAIDGLKIDRASLSGRLGDFSPGDTVTVHVFRRGHLRHAEVTLGAMPPATYTLTPLEDAPEAAIEARRAWLTGEP